MISKIIFLVIVFLSNIIQCITGFAGTVLAMPFSVMSVGYDVAKPILNVLGIAASAYIVVKDRKHVNKKEFAKIVAVMLVGIIAGFFLNKLIGTDGGLLYKILGCVVIVFAVINAYRFYTKKEDKQFPIVVSAALLIVSGIVHGMFVCGGPLLVTYLGGIIKDKREFRATISAVWIVLNTIIMFGDIQSGYFNADLAILLVVSLAVLAAALVVGNLIYKKMSRNVFLQLTYALMLISGISLLVK
ncbi:MAG: sulfite exporter TauE/SafE family protein [Faecalibacterium sp.]|nr:sulfite exporter TauE/SafE family protein [Ruminococcus sp.]MCM1391836.1 sulfite exporter TauE/SafE family protein [Ruminococcus sp.]MCM1485700.1 sulfite exporter TauE/SafE family protein [Faecalibacterium sp.]